MTVNLANNTRGSLQPVELSVVIVNWNSADYVYQCLKSIALNPPPLSYEVVVVDSGSYDQCGEMLRREFPDVVFVQSEMNVGFARANNLGVRHSVGRVLFFLNPDTEIIGNAIGKLFGTLDSESAAGLVGARLLNTDGSLQTTCIQAFPTILNQMLDSGWLQQRYHHWGIWGIAALYKSTSRPSDVEVISGACMMMKRTVFESLSGFDERFFMYSEDLDLNYRVRQAGLRCLYVPDAIIMHHGGGSSNCARSMFSVVMMRESVSRLLTFHRGQWTALCYRAALGLCAVIRLPLILGKDLAAKFVGARINPASRRKWVAIFRWSLGLESWARQQSESNKVSLEQRSVTAGPKQEGKRSCVA